MKSTDRLVIRGLPLGEGEHGHRDQSLRVEYVDPSALTDEVCSADAEKIVDWLSVHLPAGTFGQLVQIVAYRVENGLAIPSTVGHARYPWRYMKIGQSFPFNDDEYEQILFAAVKAGVSLGRKFLVSKKKKTVWRVK